MPEGHTIHRIARDQTADLVGAPVHTATVQDRFADGAARVDGRTIERIEAYGKHLFQWWEGAEVLHVHLGLFGKWTRRSSPPPPPAGEMRLRLEGPAHTWDLAGAITCRLVGPAERDEVVAGLGPDPLRRDAKPERMWTRLRRSRQPIGALLMDQTVVAGIGNVYRSELLFLVGVHPTRAGRDVTRDEFDRLWAETRHQLQLGVRRNRIVTRRPEELTRSAPKARPEDALYVYHREHCRWCGSPLDVLPLAGRRTWACPVHQT
jgi:endonuclease-8